jgi:NTE family protein
MARKLGLALGGGGARGLAHIGVLKVLEEEGLAADFVAGTSVGSLIGALYCCGYGWRELQELASTTDWSDLVTFTVPRLGLVNARKLERLVDRLVGGRTVEQLPIPFRAVAVDITAGEEVVLDRGPVSRAVRASASIPGIFEPTPWEGRLLVDGGLLDNVPSAVARDMGAQVVLAVNLSGERVKSRPPENILDVVLYSLEVLIHGQGLKGTAAADVRVVPDLEGFSYRNLGRWKEMVERGELAMRAALPALRRRLRQGLRLGHRRGLGQGLRRGLGRR